MVTGEQSEAVDCRARFLEENPGLHLSYNFFLFFLHLDCCGFSGPHVKSSVVETFSRNG